MFVKKGSYSIRRPAEERLLSPLPAWFDLGTAGGTLSALTGFCRCRSIARATVAAISCGHRSDVRRHTAARYGPRGSEMQGRAARVAPQHRLQYVVAPGDPAFAFLVPSLAAGDKLHAEA